MRKQSILFVLFSKCKITTGVRNLFAQRKNILKIIYKLLNISRIICNYFFNEKKKFHSN